jgi:D-glycerate 3-kinase
MADWLSDLIARERLPGSFAAQVETVWAPIAGEIVVRAEGQGPGFVAGVCGSQASGKSTACMAIAGVLEAQGLKVARLSLDDLYLTHTERQVLATHVYPLLATRGVPGTHDVDLGLTVLESLGRAGTTLLPRFEKARDDRGEPQAFDGPADIILFEGWCVGARAELPQALETPVNDLERLEDPDGTWRRYVNDALHGPYQDLFAPIGWLCLLAAPSFEAVLGWRLEQEAKLRDRLAREGGPGRAMDEAEVARFIAHYERLTRHILAEMPPRADRVLRLDGARQLVS